MTQGAPVFRAARQPHELSHPQIHSTALLQDKIRQLKLDRDNEVKLPPNSLLSRERGVTGDVRFASANSGGLVGSAPPRGASAASGREELEEMANMKPVKVTKNGPVNLSGSWPIIISKAMQHRVLTEMYCNFLLWYFVSKASVFKSVNGGRVD